MLIRPPAVARAPTPARSPPTPFAAWSCDGHLRRVVVDQAGEVLDLGRKQRLASTAQRLAVHARDRHCQFPGCRRPPRFCQIHHATDWHHGGLTDLDNLCLLCRHHHTLVHEGHWTLQRVEGEWTAHPPDTHTHDPPERAA